MSDTNIILEGVKEEQWRRVSPLSPLFSAASGVAVIAGALLWNNIETWRVLVEEDVISEWGPLAISIMILGGILAMALLFGIYSTLLWRRTAYAVTDQAVWFRTGILFRSQRHALLERVQEVDLVRPFIPRLVGLGKLRVGMAGAGDLTFGYLKEAVLQDLRAEILARAAGVETKEEAPESVIYSVKPTRLFQANLLKMDTILFLAVSVAFLAGATIAFIHSGDALVVIGTVPPFVGLAGAALREFIGYYGFTAAASPDGIRTRRGLLETRAQTIPPRRIHAVMISQPLLWRGLGWYRVRALQANTDDAAGEVLLPVGTWEEAKRALWLVIPDLGVDDPAKMLDAALYGSGAGQGFTSQPPRSKVLDPIVWKRRGMALTSTCAIVRDGRIRRRAAFLPYARIQSLALGVGPLRSALGLASIRVDVVSGMFGVALKNTSHEVAEELLPRLVTEAEASRQAEPPEQWMIRVEEGLANA